MALSEPLQEIQLSRKALRSNVESLARLAGARMIAASVKANAYGHGLAEYTRELAACKSVQYLAVHSIEEALTTRETGWQGKIMLLGPVAKERIDDLFEYTIEPTVFSLETLKAVGAASKRHKRSLPTHLKLETGTNRQGITESEIDQFASVYKRYKHLGRPYGASMHFANIEDTTRHDYAEYQLQEFRRLLALLTKSGIKPTIRHTASSAAMILFEKTRFELVRPGISLYGSWPSKETYLSHRLAGGDNNIFTPVLSWRTKITQVKQLPADVFVGYGCTYRTTAPTKLAVLPVGYCDGYPRSAAGSGSYVLIKGRRAPIRGRMCMNLMMVDITDIGDVKLGEQVTLIGRDGDEHISAEQIAEWAGTIQYEIFACLSPAIPRKVID